MKEGTHETDEYYVNVKPRVHKFFERSGGVKKGLLMGNSINNRSGIEELSAGEIGKRFQRNGKVYLETLAVNCTHT